MMIQEALGAKCPDGYREASAEEKFKLLEAGSNVMLLNERVAKFDAETKLHVMNAQSAARDLEDARRQLAEAKAIRRKTREGLGINPDDEKGVIIENGATFVRKEFLKLDELKKQVDGQPVTVTIKDGNGRVVQEGPVNPTKGE